VSEASFCQSGGVLVGPERIFGPEPFDYCWPLADVAIGCNHLKCRSCGASVRSAPGYGAGPDYMAHYEKSGRGEIYAAADWETLVARGILAHKSYNRFYLCLCAERAETLQTYIEDEAQWQVIDPPPPWRCAGHPRFALPGALDGLGIGADTDWSALTARALSESLRHEVPATARFGDQWLSRLYHLIQHDPLGARLSEAVFAHIGSNDPRIRVNAIDFFRRNPRAPGAERLIDLAREHYDWFAAVPNPHAADTDMLHFLLQALACRLDEGDRTPLPFLHEELLKPGSKPGYLIVALKNHDQKWLLANRNAILSANMQLANLFRELVTPEP
jgi:hypothetical protein